jgi:hypothetical protein
VSRRSRPVLLRSVPVVLLVLFAGGARGSSQARAAATLEEADEPPRTASSLLTAAGYRVYRSTQPDGPYILISGDLPPDRRSYADSAVAPETTYYYIVRRFGPDGESAPSNEACATTLPAAVPSGPGRLLNLSVRAGLVPAQPFIVGLVMRGGGKPVLVRAVGPGLASFFPGGEALAGNLRLALFDSTARLLSANEQWGGGAALRAAFAAVGAFPLPGDSADAAVVREIDGTATAHVEAARGGIGLVEMYDAGAGTTPRLVNISARYHVAGGSGALVAGFVIEGPGAKRLLIRGIGPTLAFAPFDLPAVLAKPKLELFDGAGRLVANNESWNTNLAPVFAEIGAFPLPFGSTDAALLVTLLPGQYTVHLTDARGSGAGEALLEIYEVQEPAVP